MQSALDKIRELHALQEDGLLSREEFDIRKNAILDAHASPAAQPALRGGTEIGLMVGQEVGPQNRRYRLERLLAQGGMSQVWQATDCATAAELGHSAQVALKILPPQATQNASRAKLLIAEATRARRLAHENIVRVYEWAQDPATESYFIIMEWLEGEDLDSLLAREGRLPFARVDQLLAPIASALDYAWDRHQLVHRDIKPANVFVTRKGDVKLLDFGIAARSRRTGGSTPQAPASSGTSGYRAPEAGNSKLLPSRALDVYAVAAMIHQMLTGRLPDAATGSAPGPGAAGLPAKQWTVLQAALAANPVARPASVGELLDRLRAAASLAAVPAAVQPRTDVEARAAAEARAQLMRQRREQEKLERAQKDAGRQARKEVLNRQLQARRAEEAEIARLAQEEAQRRALQAKAAAAYRVQQQSAPDSEGKDKQA